MLTKIEQLRAVIVMLADGAHRARLIELLNALEQDIGAATLTYAARLVAVRATDARAAHSNSMAGDYAATLLAQAAHRIAFTDWERDVILEEAKPVV